MPDVTTPTVPETPAAPAAPEAPPAPPSPPKKKPQKNGRKKVKNIIIAGVAIGVLAVGGYFLQKFLNSTDNSQSEIYAMPAQMGSIQSKVSGSGSAKSKESAAITLSSSGTVEEVFVNSGDIVTEGQPLYTIFSQAAQDKVTEAQKQVDKLNGEMQKLSESVSKLSVQAPFSGKLISVDESWKNLAQGDKVASGSAIGTLANDKRLKLSLYFSYAYEDQISVGQTVSVSIPAVMGIYDGRVDEIHKVSYISPEGAVHFQVIISFSNPGTLTAGMAASAVLTARDGSDIYPYQNGETEYYEVRDLTVEVGGPLIYKNLYQYAYISAGETLVTLGTEDLDDQIQAKQNEIDTAMENLKTATEGLENFNAVAPISGTITSCTLTPGAEVKENDTVIIIANNTTMLVTITVDDRNIGFIKPGDMVELNGGQYIGTVTSIDTNKAEQSSGMTSYPVTLTVENMDGSLYDGMWMDYSFVTSQSEDCILVPTGAVRYFSDMEGNRKSVVFVQRDSRPDDVPELELPTTEPGQKADFPSEEEGYYPVIVETGISDTQNVEIVSGVELDDMVFVNYVITTDSYGYGGW